MFAWRAFPARGDAAPGAYLTVPALHSAGIRVAFTSRAGGFSVEPFASLNLSFVSGDDETVVRANRARVLDALGAAPDGWTSGRQVHGARVARVTAAERGSGAVSAETTIPDVDALWSDEVGTTLAVLTADCVPVLLADPDRGRIAAVHAGWRGLASGVIGNAVQAMGGASIGVIGPAIGPCCYEVGADVADPARAALGDAVIREGDKPHLDLWRGARDALARAGVGRAALAALCTRCEPSRFYSHRAGDAARQGLIATLR